MVCLELESSLLLEQRCAERLEDSQRRSVVGRAAPIDPQFGVARSHSRHSREGRAEEVDEHLGGAGPLKAQDVEFGGGKGSEPGRIGGRRFEGEADPTHRGTVVLGDETPSGLEFAVLDGVGQVGREVAGITRQ